MSGNLQLEFVYFGGRRVAHRIPSSGNIYYYEEDMLGSSRTIVQAGQTSPCFDADFLPFGGERDITSTCSQSYNFEGKKRDPETENDDFGARYYSSRLSRWLSPDWSAAPAPVPYANLTNPQTLNLYAMVSDNPETFADLDGHDAVSPGINESSDGLTEGSCGGASYIDPACELNGQSYWNNTNEKTNANETDTLTTQLASTPPPKQSQKNASDSDQQHMNQRPSSLPDGNQKAEKPAFQAKPLSKLDKIIITLGCLAGMDPNYAKPMQNKAEAPKNSTDSTKETEGQRTVYGPDRKGNPVPYNPAGRNSRTPDNAAGAAAQAASTAECITNAWTSWPKEPKQP